MRIPRQLRVKKLKIHKRDLDLELAFFLEETKHSLTQWYSEMGWTRAENWFRGLHKYGKKRTSIIHKRKRGKYKGR